MPRRRGGRRRRARPRGAATDDRVTGICYGDSLTAGYTAASPYTGEYAPWSAPAIALGVALSTLAVAGRPDRCWITRTQKWAPSLWREAPGAGTTLPGRSIPASDPDGGDGTTWARGRRGDLADLKALHEICHASGAQTVALSIPQSKAAMAGPHSSASGGARRSLLSAYARDNAKCVYLPMDLSPVEQGSPNWEADGLHEVWLRGAGPKARPENSVQCMRISDFCLKALFIISDSLYSTRTLARCLPAHSSNFSRWRSCRRARHEETAPVPRRGTTRFPCSR